MILALALLTVTQLSPQTTSARLLAPDTVGLTGAPKREVIPGVKAVWPAFAVAGALTVATAAAIFVALVAGRAGGLVALAVGILGGLIGGVIHTVCGIVAIVIATDNANARAAYEQRKRAPPPGPASSAVTLQPTAVVLRF